MKTMTRILGLTAVLAVAAMAVPTAEANCIPGTVFGTWGGGGYYYVNLPAGSNNANVVGTFWKKGDFAGANNGPYDDSIWLRFYAPTSKWYISGDTSSGMIGCPNGGNLIIQLDLADGSSLTMESIETPATALRWDFSTLQTDFTPAPRPRPRVQTSSRSGTSVNLTINTDAQVGGSYGPQGSAIAIAPTYRLVTASGTADPGTSSAAYTPGPAITPGAPLPTSVDCSNTAADQWVAVQTLIDGVPSATVGPRTRIECDPTLADPKFKQIDRPARPNPRSGR
jgi:hypothetical protein